MKEDKNPHSALSSLKKDSADRWILPHGNYVTENNIPLEPMARKIQAVIDGPPRDLDAMYSQACSNDTVTVNSWKYQWLWQVKENASNYDFNTDNVFEFIGKEKYKPVILAGSGPSLKRNAHHLEKRKDIRIVSCLHNFGFMEDRELMDENDFYVNLDAGDITIREVPQGGTKDEAYYWERTKDRTLITHCVANPYLLGKWKGPIKFFSTPFAPETHDDLSKYIDHSKVPFFNVGGNCLGACMYMGKGILGGSSMIFVGADFAFDYTNSFHPFSSPYDSMFGGVMPATDIWGNRVWTWQSYYNFKVWFDYIACGGRGNNPIDMINCTEGGILGAYPEGNIKQIRQMALSDALYSYNMVDKVPDLVRNSLKDPIVLY